MIISIAGPPGSGKSTVAQVLADRLGMPRYYMGGMMRELARKHGMSIEEWNEYCASNVEADKELDEYQSDLGVREDDFVVEGRTSFHFIPHSIKVYLDVTLEEGARRIMDDSRAGHERNERVFSALEDKMRSLQERIDNERNRYRAYYGFDCHDKKNFDIVIGTTNKSPAQVVDCILEHIRALKA